MQDFIDSFDLPSTSWEVISEAKDKTGVVDGKNILARVVGPFFLVGGASRNGRYYSESLWEKTLQRTKDVINSGEMLGTIGHEQPLDDTAILEGKASHRVSKLWIDTDKKSGQKVGMGEILVLNTSAGRELNGVLRGGYPFPVSSRAQGEYTGKKVDGNDEIDEETYVLETFDFVRTPGVKSAVPRLVEQNSSDKPDLSDDDSDTTTDERKVKMSDDLRKIIEDQSKELAAKDADLDKALNDKSRLEAEKTVLDQKLESATGDLKVAQDKASELEGELETATSKLEGFIAHAEDPSALSKALEDSKNLADKIAEFGSIEDVEKAVSALESLVGEDSTVEDVKAKLEALGEYAEIGTPEQFNQALDLVEAYQELGSVESITEALDKAEALAEQVKSDKDGDVVETLCTKFGITDDDKKDMVESMVESMGEAEAEKAISAMTGKKVDEEEDTVDTSRYNMGESKDKSEGKQGEEGKDRLSEAQKPGARATRLFETRVN